MEDVTVEVKDGNGTVVEVQATNIPAGATAAQFDLVTPVTNDDLTGVWTVAGETYDFDEIALVSDIVAAATANNQVELNSLLAEAAIENVNVDLIATYASDIVSANGTSALVWASDVQKVIDKTNEDAAETDAETAAVQTVLDANNQIELLSALQAKFDRVNPEWIADYASGSSSAAGIAITVGSDNTIYTNSSNATGTNFADVQTAIDFVNDEKINKAVTGLDVVANTAAKQAEVTTLIQNWIEDDVAPATAKADAIEESEVNRLGFVVAEATTENSLYNALVAYANATADTVLKTSELNSNLKAEYLAEMNASSGTKRTAAVSGFTGASSSATYDYKVQIVQAADLAAKNAAMADIVAKYTALNSDNTNTTKQAAFKASLQELADVTSHETVANKKFLMSTIDDASLVAYSAAFAASTPINGTDTVANVQAKVTGVNNSAESVAQLKAINEATTAQEVKVVLDELAIAKYVNVPSVDKLHVAQQVLELRDTLTAGRDAKAAAGTASGNTSTLANEFVDLAEVEGEMVVASTGVIAVYDALVAEFAYTNLTDTATTVTQLDKLGYDAFDNLTPGQKALVAESFKANYPMDSTPAAIDYTTLKAVKTAVDTAIAGL